MGLNKIAIFVDGKNFYEGLRASGSPSRIDFAALARQVVRAAGGRVLTGLHYYTGVEVRGADGDDPEDDGKSNLEGFLSFLETQPGCFVHRFPRRPRSITCTSCGHVHSYTEEKQVDTSLVSTMIRQAAVGAFDGAVLCSGDADHTPALEALRDLGKPAWVATFAGHGLSRRLRQAAYGHIDLERLLASRGEVGDAAAAEAELNFDVVAAVLDAEAYFGGQRYVGLNMFVNDWRSDKLPQDLVERQRMIQDAIDNGSLEVYEAGDGRKAVRVAVD